MNIKKPLCSNASIASHLAIDIVDETGQAREINITAEYPLTIYLDKREMVTLMTLGLMPELLTIGWLRNQSIIKSLSHIESVQVDWEVEAVSVCTVKGHLDDSYTDDTTMQQPPRIVTSGCGQNTMLNKLMEQIDTLSLTRQTLFNALALHDLVQRIRALDSVYKKSGTVHGCMLAQYNAHAVEPLIFVEDIGRHNAVDTISGWMWANDIQGDSKVFYTTGRLTSEMVIKCAQMQIPYLVSRSGTTSMGYSVAKQIGLTMIGRALNRRYIIFSGKNHFGPLLEQ